MDWATIIGLLVALGAGGVLTKFAEGITDWLKGRHGKEQTAWERADSEARYRRKVEEALHETRRCLHERGVPYDQMPVWPSRSK